MKNSKLRFGAGALVLAFAMSAFGTTDADAQGKRVKWKMQSSFGSKLSVIGEGGPRFAKTIKRMSGGKFDIKFFEPGALVPALEVFDAVKKGAVDSAWTASGYHVGKIPALSFFTAVPFGPAAGEYLAWVYNGGGLKIYQDIYAKHNIVALPCNILAPESSGWFKEEIKSVEQLKGLKMRFFGLGAKVMQKMGVSTQLLAAGDIYPALERGVINATEFSMPSVDLDLGFHQIAKHYYFPGWHQQATILELIVNKERWDELSDANKALIEVGCRETVMWGFVTSEAVQFPAMQELQKKGVTIHRWPQATLDILKAKWLEVVQEESAKDPLFKEVWDSFTEFRKGYKLWAEHGYVD